MLREVAALIALGMFIGMLGFWAMILTGGI